MDGFGDALSDLIGKVVQLVIVVLVILLIGTGYGCYKLGYHYGYETGESYYDDSKQAVAWETFYTAKLNAMFYRKIMNTPNDIPNSPEFEKRYIALAEKAKKIYHKGEDQITQVELDEMYIEKDAIQIEEPPITKEQLKILNECQTELNKEYGYK